MTTLFHGGRKLDADGVTDDFWMLTDGDRIVSTGMGAPPETLPGAAVAHRVDLAGDWITPGFIDLHVHGGGGFAFEGGADDIRAARAVHRAQGTTRSLVSLVANPIESLVASLGQVADLVATDPTMLGSHLEGPFLSPGRRGAHHEGYLLEPTPAVVAELVAAARGTLRSVTIAPELPGALDAIEQLRASGVVVGVGHTEADADLTRAAFDRGATVLTHAFNAMPGIHHREPGPVVSALEDERVTLELVLDGVHVHPDVVAMTFRAAPDRVALITDAMAAAGSGDGHYRLGQLDVEVTHGVARVGGSDTIAGSTLTQARALQMAIAEVGLSARDAVTALTLTPARVLGLGDRFGRLAAGCAADVVRLTNDWQVREVWSAGVLASPAATEL